MMIVGVAIRNETVVVMLPKPNRHHHCFAHLNSIGVDAMKAEIGVKAKDQGFYTHTGKYLNREEAYRYTKRNNQPTTGPIKYALFSEDLW